MAAAAAPTSDDPVQINLDVIDATTFEDRFCTIARQYNKDASQSKKWEKFLTPDRLGDPAALDEMFAFFLPFWKNDNEEEAWDFLGKTPTAEVKILFERMFHKSEVKITHDDAKFVTAEIERRVAAAIAEAGTGNVVMPVSGGNKKIDLADRKAAAVKQYIGVMYQALFKHAHMAYNNDKISHDNIYEAAKLIAPKRVDEVIKKIKAEIKKAFDGAPPDTKSERWPTIASLACKGWLETDMIELARSVHNLAWALKHPKGKGGFAGVNKETGDVMVKADIGDSATVSVKALVDEANELINRQPPRSFQDDFTSKINSEVKIAAIYLKLKELASACAGMNTLDALASLNGCTHRIDAALAHAKMEVSASNKQGAKKKKKDEPAAASAKADTPVARVKVAVNAATEVVNLDIEENEEDTETLNEGPAPPAPPPAPPAPPPAPPAPPPAPPAPPAPAVAAANADDQDKQAQKKRKKTALVAAASPEEEKKKKKKRRKKKDAETEEVTAHVQKTPPASPSCDGGGKSPQTPTGEGGYESPTFSDF